MRIRGEVSVYDIIRKLQHGYQISYPGKWVSLYGFQISVAGILGVSGLILAIRDGKTGNFPSLQWWVERKDSSEKPCFVAGLRNLGNNCFLNVILQALASCPSFVIYLQKVIEEDELFEKRLESLPLTVALVALLEELGILQDRKTVLSPRQVMLGMDLYIPNFNLTSQQDAAEAFLHLLSSLRGEFLECYVPHCGSLADALVSSLRRVPTSRSREGQNEWERWQQHFLGPFDGILGSVLTCKSCSSQISMVFEFFHSLPLSPPLDHSATIIDGCTVEDCLKQFTVAEYIENYRCNRCWHIAALKYLSAIGRSEAQVEKLSCCMGQDSCDCRKLFPQDALPWSNEFSHSFKQLSIARCPQILCIHLQRASVNTFGELVKLQGHISFPLILDLFPFTKDAVGVGTEDLEKNTCKMQVKRPHHPSIPQLNYFKMPIDTRILQHIYGLAGDGISSEAVVEDGLGCSADKSPSDEYSQPIEREPGLDYLEGCSGLNGTGTQSQPVDKVNWTCPSAPSRSYMYRLVAVIEHFGRVGSGHYTVYRRLRAESDNIDTNGCIGSGHVYWFGVSDSEVFSVSEKDVLSAEASLLFYERIEQP
ncbi:ubiquitin carboxyl-terminal hydrolase 27 [Macadamia integrifolia]|uniref:ubiquitin carboxyl-terminal hydrolase 27 n=1 Tax=Macadamia integrifolia TaxID=60698 RepID=UPI001C4F08A8|nr:ubiquitin carboxyl-terminal hydrolase 27 [Macadamia integrifolia]